MNANEAIKMNIDVSDMVCGAYLGDLTDDEAMKRPHAGCNHINWQLGHLISSDHAMCTGCVAGSLPDLPAGFNEKYSKEAAASDNAADFIPKTELMELYQNQRKAICEVLAGLSQEQLNGPSPENFQSFAPTVGALFSMIGSHWLMHAGQWVILRRELGREVVI